MCLYSQIRVIFKQEHCFVISLELRMDTSIKALGVLTFKAAT